MPAADAAALLEAVDLACRRGGRLLLESVAWRLGPGEALLLRGANGSGKSSLLRLLAGFMAPAGGRLLHEGRDAFADPARYRLALHHLGYQDGLKPALTVMENLEAVASLLGAGTERLEAALDAFALRDLGRTPARFLSTGQRRRAALARLVAVERPIWLLDEPETGLDRQSREALLALIGRHRARGGIVLVASHGGLRLQAPLVLDLDGPGPC